MDPRRTAAPGTCVGLLVVFGGGRTWFAPASAPCGAAPAGWRVPPADLELVPGCCQWRRVARTPSACTPGPNTPSSLSSLESDMTIGIVAVSFTLAEASPPMTAIGQISICDVARSVDPPPGAGHRSRAGSSHSQSSGGVAYSAAWRSHFHLPHRAVTAMAALVAASAAAPSLRKACQATECHTVPMSATRRACRSLVVGANSGIQPGLC